MNEWLWHGFDLNDKYCKCSEENSLNKLMEDALLILFWGVAVAWVAKRVGQPTAVAYVLPGPLMMDHLQKNLNKKLKQTLRTTR